MPGKRNKHGRQITRGSPPNLGYPTALSVAHTHVSRLRIVDLPAELGILILYFVLPQGHPIRISHALNSAESRQFEREAAILKGEPAKCKQILKASTAVLRSCKYLARCGTTALWSGNTFVFDTMDYLRRFLVTVPDELKDLVHDVAIGEGCFAQTHYIHEEWPANSEALSGLPKLSRLTLFVGDLRKTDSARMVNRQPWKTAQNSNIGRKWTIFQYLDVLLAIQGMQSLEHSHSDEILSS
ncbi:hypothetical protein AC578_7161 [Pseudocercospora eumusae]|uniref:Uncharacterized protein n=1 Tax=Pseudocercospora eumusae TaxID=321146 RepID=A0A139HWP5_9PEZI|nr:hypothetical protein AC578_7161 [Pseudocercospora eumusae]